MKTKEMVAIVAVVIIVIAVVAAIMLIPSGNDNEKTEYSAFNVTSTRNLVFGNANNDNYLDDKDLEFIKDIVSGKTVWDKTSYPLADTNADGAITQDDVDLLQKFLNGEKATMYYLNWYKDVASVNYPVVGPITTSGTNGYDICIIDGIFDQIVGTRDSTTSISKYNASLYPGLSDRVTSVRDDAANFDAEKIYKSGTKLLFADFYEISSNLKTSLKALDPSINILELPVKRVVNEIDYSHTAITLGVMFNKQEETKDYIEFIETIEKDITNSIVSSGATKKTALLCYDPTSPNSVNLDTLSPGASQYTDITNLLRLPLTIPVERADDGTGGAIYDLEMDVVLNIDPEIIVMDTWGLFGRNLSDTEYHEIIDTKVKYFKETSAYKNDKIIVVPYEVLGGTAGICSTYLIGSYIWGNDVFNEEKAWEYLNTYFRNFTYMGKDIDMKNYLGFAPEVYGISSYS